MKLWKKGFRGTNVGQKLRASRVITETTLEYSYDETENT